MSRISTFAALCLLAGTACGNSILQGNQELGISGNIDFDTADDTLIEMNFSYGVFLADYVEVGGQIGFRDSDRVTQWNLGGFSEFHIPTQSNVVPFLGVSLDLAGADVSFGEVEEDNTAAVLGTTAGVKIFLNANVAVATALNFDFATDEIFPSDNGADDTNWDIQVGLRYYF
jgi:hypothetical protein